MKRAGSLEGDVAVSRRRAGGWPAAIACALLALPGAGTGAEPTPLPDGGRGETLYQLHCVSCHDSLLHVRTDRRAATYTAVTDKVRFWSDLQRLDWTEQDIDAVAAFLNTRYYRFDVPSVEGGVRR